MKGSAIKFQGSVQPLQACQKPLNLAISGRSVHQATFACENPEKNASCRCWSSLKSGMSADEIHGANELMMERQEAEFATLKRLEGLVTAAEGTFVGAASAKELDPSATADALSAENEAAENAQVRHAALNPPPFWRRSTA